MLSDLRSVLERCWVSPVTLAVCLTALLLHPFRSSILASFRAPEAFSLRHIARTIAHQFVHANGIHLFYDVVGVLVAGVLLEPILGSKRFALMFVVITAAAAAASAHFYFPHTAVGLSGIQQGIVGGLIAACFFYLHFYRLAVLLFVFYIWKCVSEVTGQSSYLTVMKWLGVASESFSSVAYWCHIAGMSMGFLVVMSFAFLERRRKDDSSAVT